MPDPLKPGDKAVVIHDVVINNEAAFSMGEGVTIERVEPNPERPDYKYVLLSPRLQRWFQLSDAEVAPAVPSPSVIQPPPQPQATAGPAPPGPPMPPGNQQYPPPPPTAQKSSGVAKGCLIAAAILVVLVIIVVVILVAVVGVGVHKAVKEVEKVTNRKVVQVSIGKAGQTGSLSVKVLSWKPSPGDELNTPKAGNQFIVVDLEIQNTGTKNESISTMAEMSIKTPNGYKYDQALFFPEPQFPDGDILPGQTARGNVAFEAPANIGTMNFAFDPVFVGDIIQVKLQ